MSEFDLNWHRPNARAHETAPLLQVLPRKLRSLELGRMDFNAANELDALVQFTCLVRLIVGVHYSVRCTVVPLLCLTGPS